MQFEIDDAQIQASAKKELEIAVSGLRGGYFNYVKQHEDQT